MSTYGTAAHRVARRHARSAYQNGHARYDSDGETETPRPASTRPASSVRSRARSHSPSGRHSPTAANKVFSGTISKATSEAGSSASSVWQPKSVQSGTAVAGRTRVVAASRGSRPGSGRSSPVNVVNMPVVDHGHRLTMSAPRPSTMPNTKRQVARRRNDDDYLAYLGVHLDREDTHYYSPGETIHGKIILRLKRRVFIDGLDFRLKGKLDVLLAGSQNSHRESETFLYHCHRMVGVWDTRATQLEPGSYVSHFKYVLPNRLPNSVTKFTSCQVRVAYGIQAILIDMNKDTKQVSKTFLVQSPSTKIALTPVYHIEPVDETTIGLTIDSSSVIVGRPCTIRVDSKLRLSQITVYLEQTMKAKEHRVDEILNKFKCKNHKPMGEDGQTHVVRLMIPDSAMTDLKRFTKAVSIEQNLHIRLKYKDKWIHYSLPVQVHPGTCQFGDDIPTFGRVKRYPTLESSSPANGHAAVPITVDLESETWLNKVSKLFKHE